MTKASAIIVAAGKGTRMDDKMRKQYISLAGRPLLCHTLLAFNACTMINELFLVVPRKDVDFCLKIILSPLKLQKKITLVPGGPERQDSVYNGLLAMEHKENIIVIHDGVRPFIKPDQIAACINGAKEFGACILGIPAYDTLKKVSNSGYIEKTIERDSIWLIQTPQAFQYELILKAHKIARQDEYTGTDDALLVERIGKDIKVIPGSKCNIKITTKKDLKFAKAMIETGNHDYSDLGIPYK